MIYMNTKEPKEVYMFAGEKNIAENGGTKRNYFITH